MVTDPNTYSLWRENKIKCLHREQVITVKFMPFCPLNYLEVFIGFFCLFVVHF